MTTKKVWSNWTLDKKISVFKAECEALDPTIWLLQGLGLEIVRALAPLLEEDGQ